MTMFEKKITIAQLKLKDRDSCNEDIDFVN